MKKILLSLFILISISTYAQDLSYGVVLGTNWYDLDATGGAINTGEEPKASINVGGFADYKISESFGVKGDLTFNSIKEGYSLKGFNYRFVNKLNTLQFIPKIKFDTNKEYNKGFYITAGPRMSIVLSSKDEDGNDTSGFYKGTFFGGQFGFGVTFFKHFSAELIGDISLSSSLDSETELKTAGAYFNLNINLESLINK